MSAFRRLLSGTKASISTELLLGTSRPRGLVFQSHVYTSVSVIRLRISYSQRMGLFMFLCPPMLSCRRCSEIGYPIITSHHYLTLNCNMGKGITGLFTRAYFLCDNTFAGSSVSYFVAHLLPTWADLRAVSLTYSVLKAVQKAVYFQLKCEALKSSYADLSGD